MDVGDVATWVGVLIALAVAVEGVRQGRKGQQAAARALSEAERANEISERTRRQQFEHSDVRWKAGFEFGTTRWMVENVGTDTAVDVQVQFLIKLDSPRTVEAEELAPEQAVYLDLSDALEFEFRHGLRPNQPPRAQASLPYSQSIRWRTVAGVEKQELFEDAEWPLRRELFPTLSIGAVPEGGGDGPAREGNE